MPTARRIALAAGLALCVGLAAVRLFDGPHENGVLALLELVALVVCALAVVGGTLLAIGLRMADWREPESESDFEQVVHRSERLAQVGTAAEPEEGEFLELDPWSDADF